MKTGLKGILSKCCEVILRALFISDFLFYAPSASSFIPHPRLNQSAVTNPSFFTMLACNPHNFFFYLLTQTYTHRASSPLCDLDLLALQALFIASPLLLSHWLSPSFPARLHSIVCLSSFYLLSLFPWPADVYRPFFPSP